MKITELNVKTFGKIKDLELSNLSSDIVLVYGRNESGKTTLFHVLRTLLFGFEQAQLSLHPYAPWTGEGIELSGKYVLQDGEQAEIVRRLTSSPQGKIISGMTSENLRNQPLPQVAHVSGDIYSQVYSLGLDDLIMLKDTAWDEVQDMLLVNFGGKARKTPREILAEIDQEAAALWRDDHRGKPRSREIQDQMSLLMQKRREAIERNREIYRLEEECLRKQEAMDLLQVQKTERRVRLRKIERLLPLKHTLQKITGLERMLEQMCRSEGFSESPRSELEALESAYAENHRVIIQKETLLEELAGPNNELSQKYFRLFEMKQRIRDISEKKLYFNNLQEGIAKAGKKQSELELRLTEKAKELLEVEWNTEYIDTIQSVNVIELRQLVGEFRSLRERQNSLRASLESARTASENAKAEEKMQRNRRALSFMTITVVVTAAIWVAAEILFGPVLRTGYQILDKLIPVLAEIIIAIASYRIWLTKGSNNTEIEDTEVLNNILLQVEEDREKRVGEIHRLFNGFPVLEYRLQNPDGALVYDMEIMVESSAEWRRQEDERQQLKRQFEGLEKELVVLVSLIGHSYNSLRSPEEGIELLNKVLDEAEENMRKLESKKSEMDRVNKELEGLMSRQDELTKKMDSIRLKLKTIGEGDYRQGLEILEERLALEKQLQETRKELKITYPELEEDIKEIEELESSYQDAFTDSGIEVLRNDSEKTSEEISELEKQCLLLKSSNQRLQDEPGLSDIDSEIAVLNDELELTYNKRDRLVLMHNIIKKAEQEFRDEHQPDVLKRAGEYLSMITEGRYEKLYFQEDGGKTSLVLKGKAQSFPVAAVSPLSKGTVEQVYLSLRLSLVDHLDAEYEKLPLCLDEVFVNWDNRRMDDGLEAIRELAQNRQIFLFTCRDEFVRLAGEKLNASVVAL